MYWLFLTVLVFCQLGAFCLVPYNLVRSLVQGR